MALSCTAAMAADAPAKKPWKEGWDRKQVKVFAYACTDGLLEPRCATTTPPRWPTASRYTSHFPNRLP